MADRASTPSLRPEIAPLAFLLGRWQGSGRGDYPTIESFGYLEEVRFDHVGKPFLTYWQRTRDADDPSVLRHSETGFWRMAAADRVELVLAHPTGVVEAEEGELTIGNTGRHVIDLASTHVVGTSTAKEVLTLSRHIEIEGDMLQYQLSMGAVGQPHQHHLEATLHRDGDD